MSLVLAFLVDFQNAADVARKRQSLQSWSEGMLRTTLNRNRIELMNEPDSLRCRQILSGSILIRCELTRRQTGAVLGDAPKPGPSDGVARFA